MLQENPQPKKELKGARGRLYVGDIERQRLGIGKTEKRKNDRQTDRKIR